MIYLTGPTTPQNSYLTQREINFHNRLSVLLRWVRANGRIPDEHATDADEQYFGRWLANQRRRYGQPGIVHENARTLDFWLTGWRAHRKDITWERHLHDCVTFRRDRLRNPVEDSLSSEERALGYWLQKQNFFQRKGTLSAERISRLNERLPGWQLLVAADNWLYTAKEIGVFHKREGAFPSKISPKPDERRLGAWLHNQRTRLTGATAKQQTRIVFLDSVALGWRMPAAGRVALHENTLS